MSTKVYYPSTGMLYEDSAELFGKLDLSKFSVDLLYNGCEFSLNKGVLSTFCSHKFPTLLGESKDYFTPPTTNSVIFGTIVSTPSFYWGLTQAALVPQDILLFDKLNSSYSERREIVKRNLHMETSVCDEESVLNEIVVGLRFTRSASALEWSTCSKILSLNKYELVLPTKTELLKILYSMGLLINRR